MDKAGVEFDESFEAQRLSMLSQQFPEMAEGHGNAAFYAEDDEVRLSQASWEAEGGLLDAAGEPGLKLYLMELLISIARSALEATGKRYRTHRPRCSSH